MDARNPVYRFIVLLFTCFLTFGSYFCFDMPSVLQAQFQANFHCNKTDVSSSSTKNITCCDECLGMDSDEYNLLYFVYAWTNAFVVIGSGFLIDKMGNRVGVFLFSFLCVLGSSIFALGSFFQGSKALLPVMLLGRLLFGAGNGSLTIVQNRITAFWFTGKELALAFGIVLAFSRLGSVLNFFVTPHLYSALGLRWTLWIGAILCGLGFLSAIVVSFLDVVGVRQLGQEANMTNRSKRLRFTDIRFFTIPFWLLALTIMFFYNGVFPFVADASKFIQDKYDYDSDIASYVAGAVYDVSMVFSPFLGGIIDIFGKRGILAITCAVGTIPVFGLLAFSHVYPLVSTLWLGVTYSVAAASLWPSIPLVVPQATIGTAMGLTTSLQMIGIGISNLIEGGILGSNDSISISEKLLRWKYVMIYLLANVLACAATAIALNVVDQTRGGILNLSKHQLREALGLTNETPSINSEEEGKESSSHTQDEEKQHLIAGKSVIS